MVYRFATFLVLISAVSAVAAEPPVDSWGDPLPPGASRRFGTTRLRQQQGVTGVTFAPDGRTLVSTGWTKSIRFWDAETGRAVKKLAVPGMNFAAVFSPDGSRLVTVGDGCTRYWDVAAGKLLFESERSGNRNYGIAFDPSGWTFATAGDDSLVYLWDAETGEQLLQLDPETRIRDAAPLAFSPNGAQLASSGPGRSRIRIWNLTTGKWRDVIPAERGFTLIGLGFTDDNTLISSGSQNVRRDGTWVQESQVRVWSLSDEAATVDLSVPQVELKGAASMALSGDRRRLVTSHFEKLVVWDVAKRRAERVIPNGESIYRGARTHGVSLSPDGELIASRGTQHKVRLWNATTGEPLLTHERTHDGGVLAVSESPDGRLIATAGEEGDVHLWDVATGRHVRQLLAHRGWARDVCFFPSGDRIAVCGEFSASPNYKGILEIVRLEDAKTLHKTTLDNRGMCVTVSPDGRSIAVAIGLSQFLGESGPLAIHLFDAETFAEVGRMEDLASAVSALHFTADSQHLWAMEERTAKRWTIGSKTPDEKIAFDGAVRGQASALIVARRLALLGGLVSTGRRPDDSYGQLECRGFDDQETVWSQTYEHEFPRLITATANGQRICVVLQARSSLDKPSRFVVLETQTGREFGSYDLGDARVRSLAFSKSGQTLFTGMDRGDIVSWDLREPGPTD